MRGADDQDKRLNPSHNGEGLSEYYFDRHSRSDLAMPSIMSL